MTSSASNESSTRPNHSVALERFQELEVILRNNPIHANPYLELATIYVNSRRWNDARRVLDRALEQFSENEELLVLREETQLGRSLELFIQAESNHRTEPTRLTEEALQSSTLELNSLREKIYRERIRRHPENVELFLPLAEALDNLGNTAEAIECLKQAAADPRFRADAAYRLGEALRRLKRIPEALSAYRRAALFRVPPPKPELKKAALMAAADLAQRNNMIDSARRYVELLVEICPEDTELRKRLTELQATPL